MPSRRRVWGLERPVRRPTTRSEAAAARSLAVVVDGLASTPSQEVALGGRTVHERASMLAHVPLRSHLRSLSSHHGLSQRLRYSDRRTSTKEPTPCYRNINVRGGRGSSRIAAARPHTDAPAARGRARRPGSEQSPSPARGPAAASHNPRLRLGGRPGSTYPDSAWGARDRPRERLPHRGQPPGAQQPHEAAVAQQVELLPSKQRKWVRVPPAAPNRTWPRALHGPQMRPQMRTQQGETRPAPDRQGCATSGAAPTRRLSRPVSTGCGSSSPG